MVAAFLRVPFLSLRFFIFYRVFFDYMFMLFFVFHICCYMSTGFLRCSSCLSVFQCLSSFFLHVYLFMPFCDCCALFSWSFYVFVSVVIRFSSFYVLLCSLLVYVFFFVFLRLSFCVFMRCYILLLFVFAVLCFMHFYIFNVFVCLFYFPSVFSVVLRFSPFLSLSYICIRACLFVFAFPWIS